METAYYSKKKQRQDLPCIIFVEGQDDAYFLSSLLEEIGAKPTEVGIVGVDGKENFSSHLRGFLKSPNFTQGKVKSVAIICDADSCPLKAEASIAAIFKAAGQPVIKLGTYVTNATGVQIGLFTMPNTSSSGDLEKLCLDTVEGSPLEQKAEAFIAAAESDAAASGTNLNGSRHKRKAHVFLAGQPGELVRGAGRGYSLGLFPRDHHSLNPLRAFLAATLEFS